LPVILSRADRVILSRGDRVILSREDGEGSQASKLEILRFAQDDTRMSTG